MQNDSSYSLSPASSQSSASGSHTLTFVTTEGMDISAGEAAALMGEEALAKIWNRPGADEVLFVSTLV